LREIEEQGAETCGGGRKCFSAIALIAWTEPNALNRFLETSMKMKRPGFGSISKPLGDNEAGVASIVEQNYKGRGDVERALSNHQFPSHQSHFASLVVSRHQKLGCFILLQKLLKKNRNNSTLPRMHLLVVF